MAKKTYTSGVSESRSHKKHQGNFLMMFNQERKEHPSFTKEQIKQIVKDHMHKSKK